MTVPLSLIEQLREFDTPTVAESMAALGCSERHKNYMGDPLRLLTDVAEPMVGLAITMEADTSSPDREANVDGVYDAVEKMEQSMLPTVVVMKAVGARPRHECMLGDGMGKTFKSAGGVGVVTDGGARDLDGLTRLGMPIFGTGAVCDHATLVYALATEPITISDVTLNHGDLIHADNNGVLRVPPIYHHAIVEACCLTREFETRVHLVWCRSDVKGREKRRYAGEHADVRTDKCRQLMQRQ